jgi:hypothetical protein
MGGMGLGGGPKEWDDLEWVDLALLPVARVRRQRTVADPHATGGSADALAHELSGWLERNLLWLPGAGTRVLLVDLDNLRADPRRWQARMSAVVTLARQADHVVLAGQEGAVRRGRPHLAEFAERARPVADGSDLADHVLLEAASALQADAGQVLVVSNDGIFASLADHGPLVVLSPGAEALSDRLREAAARVVDLVALEEGGTERDAGPVLPPPAKRSARKRTASR